MYVSRMSLPKFLLGILLMTVSTKAGLLSFLYDDEYENEDVMFRSGISIQGGISTTDEALIRSRLNLTQAIKSSSLIIDYTNKMYFLVGKRDWEGGVENKSSVYGVLRFAYHFHVPPKLEIGDYLPKVHVYLRVIDRLWKAFELLGTYETICTDVLQVVTDPGTTTISDELRAKLEMCVNDPEITDLFNNTVRDKDYFEGKVEDGVLYAMWIVIESFWYACLLPKHSATGQALAHFPRMLEETEEMDRAFNQAILDVEAYAFELIDRNDFIGANGTLAYGIEIRRVMAAVGGNYYISAKSPDVLAVRRFWVDQFCKLVKVQFYGTWPEEYKDWEGAVKLNGPELIRVYYPTVEALYSNGLRAELLNPLTNSYTWYDIPPSVGQPTARYAFHNMRSAWEYVSYFTEELKFIANKSYYNNYVRREALKAAQANVVNNKTKLFQGISHTLGEFCISNETDLVGTCNRKNNEICSPMTLTEWESPEDDTLGGLSVLKPKWIIARDELTGKPKEYRVWAIKYNTCRCGFRMDCGSDLEPKQNINCILQPNNHILKQCRGSIGYPCKTHPMQAGKYHESCVTGFCDLEYNYCARGPHRVTYDKVAGAASFHRLIIAYFGIALTTLYILKTNFQNVD